LNELNGSNDLNDKVQAVQKFNVQANEFIGGFIL